MPCTAMFKYKLVGVTVRDERGIWDPPVRT